ncbi:MAG: tRNA-dihydrouridine synthase family protein [Clostridiales bacterium]|nr:tRNA-dihydrouridine synthase family protein [Candidatus Cacconaster stercorequi]
MANKCYAAPMEGLTTYIWRRAHHEIFGGADKYFTPFLSPNATCRFQTKELDELRHNEGLYVVPQILTNCAEHFIWAARELQDMGYREVNFNLGCPSGTVTAKRKGAGMLAYPEVLNACLEQIFSALPEMQISVKTRIGKLSPEEWPGLLAIYNQYPISELIVHPRVQKEFYTGTAHREVFFWTAEHTTLPLVYNGDLQTVSDMTQFTACDTVMLGRGLMARPGLIRQMRGGAPATRGELTALHDVLLEEYGRRLSGDKPVLHRMRELWNYLSGSFSGTEEYLKRIRKAQSVGVYRAAAEELLRDCPLIEE